VNVSTAWPRAGSCGSPVHKHDVGGHVQLAGRKAITPVVLDVGLADVVEGP
jgi:hypothetical protein